MSTLVWIHEDSLSPRDPALLANPDAPAVFVWDDEAVDAEAYSLKRIVFQYECLVDMPVEIHRGPVLDTLLGMATHHGADSIAVTRSVNPRFGALVKSLERHLPVIVHAPLSFVPSQLNADLRRFARFWKRAEAYAFRRTQG